VRVNLDIKEGNRAKIRQINIVGNKTFKAKDILETLTLKTPNWTPGTSRTIAIRANRCRATWRRSRPTTRTAATPISRIDSVQVAISPDKSDVFITANITEGVVYKISASSWPATWSCPRRSSGAGAGQAGPDLFAEDDFSSTQELIKNRLGAEGFFFAKVEPVPTHR
jgi:outer membrane protein insertion porin family